MPCLPMQIRAWTAAASRQSLPEACDCESMPGIVIDMHQSVPQMPKPSDIRVVGATLYFLPIQARVPLKFGRETVTSVTCARACLTIADTQGRTAAGWGETPLSVTWVWPSKLAYEMRHAALKSFCKELARAW